MHFSLEGTVFVASMPVLLILTPVSPAVGIAGVNLHACPSLTFLRATA